MPADVQAQTPTSSPGVQLTPRLQKVLEQIGADQMSCTLADIGADHAKLAIAALQANRVQKAIAVEVASHIFRAADIMRHKFDLQMQLEFRIGDGLMPLQPGDADTVSICGMGGSTIVKILEKSPQVAQSVQTLILQPNNRSEQLRRFCLVQKGWQLHHEFLVAESKHLYPIMVVHPHRQESGSTAPKNGYSSSELRFGPLLLHQKDAELKNYLLRQQAFFEGVLKRLEKTDTKAPDSVRQLQQKLETIRRALEFY